MVNKILYCDDCMYLSMTEKKQNRLRALDEKNLFHVCEIYEMRLYHYNAHPHIIRYKECKKYKKGVVLR